jgi:hypothetical protein
VALGAFRVGDAGVMPLPAVTFEIAIPIFDPSAVPVPQDIRVPGRQIREH